MCDALVELSLALAARGRLGTSGAVADGLRRLLPAMPGLVAAEPRRLPVAVVNALHHLDVSPTGDPAGWVDTMLELRLRTANVPELLDAGAVAAWRRGLAQLRDGGTRRPPPGCPTPLVRIALGTTSTVDLAAAGRRPVARPGADRPVRRRAAAGPAGRRVPRVRRHVPQAAHGVHSSDGRWYATDGEDTWRVYADRFGVSLRPGRRRCRPVRATCGPLVLKAGGIVTDTATGAALELPELADATSWASAGGTLAATTPWTHGILFVARTAG